MLKKSLIRSVIIILYCAIILTGLYAVSLNQKLFYAGFHNFDLGHNARYLSEVFDAELQDTYDYNKTATPIDMIIRGSDQMQRSNFYSLILTYILVAYSMVFGMMIVTFIKELKDEAITKNEDNIGWSINRRT